MSFILSVKNVLPKFAKYSPPTSESESALSNTKKVIEQIDKLIFTDQS